MKENQNHTSPQDNKEQEEKINKADVPVKGKKKIGKWIAWGVGIVAVVAVIVVLICVKPDKAPTFKRAYLDEYVQLEAVANKLKDGSAVYIDMSEGMNHAYSGGEVRAVLKSIIDLQTGEKDQSKFYELTAQEVHSLDSVPPSDVFNYVMNSSNFKTLEAPIQKALEQIAANNQPAVLVTDYEEYVNDKIQSASYAKDSFTKWLSNGNFITFLRWEFSDKDNDKLLFVTVFDGADGEFTAKVENAIQQSRPHAMQKFVLGGRKFEYPMLCRYTSDITGGNYHDSKGQDFVSGILEDGSAEAYVNYGKIGEPVRTDSGNFKTLEGKGFNAQYYPLGATWTDIVNKSSELKEGEGENVFTHFLGNLYVSFDSQDGYTIQEVQAQVLDINNQLMKNHKAENEAEDEENGDEVPEITEMFEASLSNDSIMGPGNRIFREIFVDFNELFTGKQFNTTSSIEVKPTDLLRVNVVISKYEPNTERAKEFFSWPENESLSAAIESILTNQEISPLGTILMSYYIRNSAETNGNK